MKKRIALSSLAVATIITGGVITTEFLIDAPAWGHSREVMNNLRRTRAALLDQRESLRKAIHDTKRNIDELTRSLDTLESYLQQTDADLREVESAMRGR